MGRVDQLAVPPGVETKEYSRKLLLAHDNFVSSGRLESSLRELVRESWRRSVESGVNPEELGVQIPLDDRALRELRDSHPLAAVMPLIRRLLVEDAADAGHVVAVSDAIGQLLWVEGDNRLRSAAEAMHFMPGADWSERSAGTNAPGTALALGKPVQIFGPEHLGRLVTPWSCTAAPIRDPDTGIILGVLDITGGDSVASPQTLSLVRATVAAVESELRLARSHHPRFISASMSDLASPHLDVLSPHGATLRHGTTVTRLSQRHSEIMLLLAHAPDGLSSAELAVALSEQNYSDVSIRAEMTRLRPLLGPVQIGSKPYRLKTRVSLDIDDVRDHLAGGELRIALGKYQYPVLPHSVAPGVCEIRDELQMRIRAAVLSSADPETVLAFADSTHGAQDYEVWRHAYFLLPSGSPRRKYAASKCEKFESERE